MLAQRKGFGLAMRERRRSKQLTQDVLAALCNVDRKTISRMETGSYAPTLDTVYAVASALGVTVGSLAD